MPYFNRCVADCVVLENGSKSPILVKAIIHDKDRILMVFAYKTEYRLNFTCEVRPGETICLRGTYWSFESFEEALLRHQDKEKEVVLSS